MRWRCAGDALEMRWRCGGTGYLDGDLDDACIGTALREPDGRSTTLERRGPPCASARAPRAVGGRLAAGSAAAKHA